MFGIELLGGGVGPAEELLVPKLSEFFAVSRGDSICQVAVVVVPRVGVRRCVELLASEGMLPLLKLR